ncbi:MULTISPECIES: TIGR02450 family Trp-rich protein [Pseudomonas]|uniref:TIGR02450 family Trp-rich protein n=1 Tax=Pseudomonas segetis TaxID=298908 RepID=A0A238Z8R8_9PSED|nr:MULTISPECIES: TIGR02450 family Trp-rich protein [Pseudomonas]SNR79660.1 tryptophan-rich conserved hypothetical protein [Pseudomonas segetis]
MNACQAPRRINPQKLLLSKWTAVTPRNREKHFIVTDLVRDEQGQVLCIELQAVLTKRSELLAWQSLQHKEQWLMGWK